MISPAFRFLLFLGSVLAAASAATPLPVDLILTAWALLLFVGFWRNGTVPLAWRAHDAGDFEEMERCLGWTPTGRFLSPVNRAYYDLLHGISARERGDLAAARSSLNAAVEGALRTPADRCLALITLAEVHAELGDATAAHAAIGRARRSTPPLALARRMDRLETTGA